MAAQLIFLGAPGSGKGTQANKLVEATSYSHISTGDLLREEIGKGTELGNRVKSIMDEGKLVDDQTMLELLKANCDLDSKTYIFDGFPRNIEQTEALHSSVLNGIDSKAVYFKINPEVIVERITNRRIAKGSGQIYNLITKPPRVPGKCDISGEDLIQRKDDNEETVRTRLKVFADAIEPVLGFYREKGMLVEIDAGRSSEEVFNTLIEVTK